MEVYIPSMIVIGIVMWFMSWGVIDKDYNNKQKLVDSITYEYAQIGSKKAVFPDSLYIELEEELDRIGEFDILIWAEKYNSDGTKESIYGEEVINRDLREEDYEILSVYAEAKNKHAISVFYNMTPFGQTGLDSEIKIVGISSGYIQ